jgi:hypothetical protein
LFAHSYPGAQPVVLRAVHVLPHVVAEMQPKLPGHGPAVVGMQLPEPLQVPAGVRVPLLHEAVPQVPVA